MASGTTAWSTSGIALQSGTNTISVTAINSSGTTATGSVVVTYNTGTITSATYYISPLGGDGNDGRTPTTPWKSFSYAFSHMASGNELILLDGTYSEAAGTGYISYVGTNSGQIPSGIDQTHPTYVHALSPGNVKVMGALFVGRSTGNGGKHSYITIEGITFDGGTTDNAGSLYNTGYVTIKNCGFHSESQSAGAVLGIGTNDGDWGNSYDVLQDIWVWGKERASFIVYRSDHIVVRRAVTRQDGCDSFANGCGNNSGNYIVGTTIYNSFDVSFQNVIAADNIQGPGGYAGAGDFYTAWHNNYVYPWYGNEWLGTISLNSGLSAGYGFDLDTMPAAQQPMATYRDVVAWNGTFTFNAQENGCSGACDAQNLIVSNGTFMASSGNGFRIGSDMASGQHDIKNIVVLGSGTNGVNSVAQPSYVDVSGSWSQGAYNQAPCVIGCLTTDPKSNGSLKYIVRIENGSPLKGTGYNGADYGANVVNRYGADGSRYGEASYNTLTSTPLWPWPNESRIKAEMCASATRGFCAAGTRIDGTGPITLTTYIWEALGNPIPAGIY